jgi:flagellar assembly protein FliH
MAQVLSANNDYVIESFQLNSFNEPTNYHTPKVVATQQDNISSKTLDAILSKLDNLSNEMTSIKQDNVSNSKKIDSQVIEALTSLNNHSKQFDKITNLFEEKLIAYSLKIASKIINQEVQQNSNQIALGFAKELILKLKDATKISVHVNPKDYEYLNTHLDLASTIELIKDSNVSPAGIVISSDIGNFDSTIESKLDTLSQSIQTLY